MAHVGEKLALGPIRGLRRKPQYVELGMSMLEFRDVRNGTHEAVDSRSLDRYYTFADESPLAR
jgi:hypothetical protein